MSHTFHIILTDDRYETVIADGYELDIDTGYVNFHNGIDIIASFAMRSVDGVTEEPEDVATVWSFSGEKPRGTDAIDEKLNALLGEFARRMTKLSTKIGKF